MYYNIEQMNSYNMNMLERINKKIAAYFIEDFENIDNKRVRIKYGFVAGWVGIWGTLLLFFIKMTLGLLSGSISIMADAFHLISNLAHSIILVVSFKVTARPATAKNPFGHGRMEHVTPLIMSIFLFVSGLRIAKSQFIKQLTLMKSTIGQLCHGFFLLLF